MSLLPRVLPRGAWSERAPRLAIAVWLAACASAVVSAFLAGVAAAVPGSVVGHGLAGLFQMCAAMLSGGSAFATTGGRLAMTGSLLIASWAACCGLAVLLRARRERRRHALMLRILGRPDDAIGATVVEHDEPVAYCLPGRRGQAVITTGALRSLAPEEVAAVIAHERAHLRGRHHLLLAAVETLVRAFPRLPLFAQARDEVTRLVELLADDVAASRHPRIHIAAALVRLATGRAPAFTLGAGGETAITRVRRMLDPKAPLNLRERLAGVITITALLSGPAAVALVPGISVFLAHHCHRLTMF
ncbi:M56 family metallopeptidase [Acrocarpospora catenulata]|uniref:M56 family metallopeptidase n=1 Tax=Acrocarpospora catenulata TaxID=2836182 RepID=UPI001BD96F00|nr:M56 family metallopeptidase [Acrocarpospora catenulata]